MQRLLEVLRQELPVGGDHALDAAAEARMARSGAGHALRRSPQRFEERRRARVERGKEQALPARGAHRGEAVFVGVEALQRGRVRRIAQRPGELVSPAVVRAAKGTLAAAPGLAERGTAVRAHVVEGADLEIGAAGEDHVLAADVGADPGAREGDLVFAADTQPLSREDRLALEGEDRRLEIDARGELRGARERREHPFELGAVECEGNHGQGGRESRGRRGPRQAAEEVAFPAGPR